MSAPIVDWHEWPVEQELIEEILRGPVSDANGDWRGDGRWKRAFLELLDRVAATDFKYPEGRYSGRGIISTTSAKSGWSSGKFLPHGYLPGTWVLCNELRELGCRLPIWLAYLGFEELDARTQRLFAPLACGTFDMRWHDWFKDRMRILAGWETKIYAVIHSPFEEVLFLDSDNVPARDPSFLFDCEPYDQMGAIFWPDLPPSRRGEWVPPEAWHSVGLRYRDYIDFESGQFLINKRRCWKELQVCRFINECSDYWYRLVFGDKTTWFLAWQKLGTPYAMPPAPAGWVGRAIIQHDFAGQMLFQHACQDKPLLSGYKLDGYLRHGNRCNAHLARLRELWDGHLWHSYEVLPQDIFIKHAGRYHYARTGLGEGHREIELRADGSIGDGRDECEHTWRLHHDLDHVLVMVLYRNDKMPVAVMAQHEGVWQGQWIQFEKCRCELRPI